MGRCWRGAASVGFEKKGSLIPAILPMNLPPISEGRVHETLKWVEEIRDSQARPSEVHGPNACQNEMPTFHEPGFGARLYPLNQPRPVRTISHVKPSLKVAAGNGMFSVAFDNAE